MTAGLPYTLGRKAEADLDEIWYYVAKQSERAADRLVEELRKTFRFLGKNPLAGEIFDSYRPFLRRFTDRRYVVYYQTTTDPITIVRILHGARDATDLI